MRRLRRYACGLACLVTVIALVGCGQATGTKAVDLKPIPDVKSLKVGSDHTVSLVGTFSGEKLTYKAKSSNNAIATVKVAGVHLTVTGVAPGGPVTITVTATDAQDRSSKPHTFNVTVVKPPPEDDDTDDDDDEGAPTVKDDAPDDEVEIDEGDTEEVDLSDVFDGDDLEFTETSDDATVATANISGTTLTITAVGPGSATITVTAKNDAGSEDHDIEVTVPDDGPPDQGPPVTREDCSLSGSLTISLRIIINTEKKCTLPANHSLIYNDPSGKVSVDGPIGNNVWTITAYKKGLSVVRISKNTETATVGTIMVTVPNTSPKLNTTKRVIFMASGTDATPISLITTGVTNSVPGGAENITELFNPGGSFTDIDPTDYDDPATTAIEDTTGQGVLRFRILDKPDGVLIDTHNGFVAVSETDTGSFISAPTNTNIYTRAIILKEPSVDPYEILLYAYDLDNAESNNPVTLKVAAQPPQMGDYSLEKSTDGKSYKTHKVGNRIGVEHTVTVPKLLPDEEAFGIVDDAVVIEKLEGKILRSSDGVTSHTISTTVCSPIEDVPTTWGTLTGSDNLGSGCWRVSSSKATIAQDSIPPKFKFTLPDSRQLSDTSVVTVTMKYYVRALETKTKTTGEITEGHDASKKREAYSHSSWQKTITLDVLSCEDEDVKNVAKDCPLT